MDFNELIEDAQAELLKNVGMPKELMNNESSSYAEAKAAIDQVETLTNNDRKEWGRSILEASYRIYRWNEIQWSSNFGIRKPRSKKKRIQKKYRKRVDKKIIATHRRLFKLPKGWIK